MSNIQIDKVVIRIAGDSGDGIQLIGNQLSDISVIESGNDIYTFVEFPSEIRAPSGSISGVSGFQLTISSKKIYSIDNNIDLLFAFNPAALKINFPFLKKDGILIIDSDSFNDRNLKKAGYLSNPLFDIEFSNYKLIQIPITSLTYECVKDIMSSTSKAKKCKNFFVLGIICWIYDRKLDGIIKWLNNKFDNSELFLSNKKALLSGYNYSDTLELFQNQFNIPRFSSYDKNNKLLKISGNKAFALSAVFSSFLFKIPIFSANYPITPASDIFQELLNFSNEDLKVIQLEDEIAAINAIIGASYGGSLSFTCTSGPGLDLMQEGIGLAIMSELPIVVLDIQRCGPSTGIPTKSEQTDLLSAVFGRHGESGVIVLSPISPSDCFWILIEAFCFSIVSLSPVIVLSDANLANSSELWKIPNYNDVKNNIFFDFSSFHNRSFNSFKDKKVFNDNVWKIPGYCDKIFCIGGLERDLNTGNVSHDPVNHFNMIKKRSEKLNNIVNYYNKLEIIGNKGGTILVISWGSVCGVIKSLYNEFISSNETDIFSILCLRYINPLPSDLHDIILSFKKIIVIEENMGQLSFLLKSHYSINVININQVTGKPFDIFFIKQKILDIL